MSLCHNNGCWSVVVGAWWCGCESIIVVHRPLEEFDEVVLIGLAPGPAVLPIRNQVVSVVLMLVPVPPVGCPAHKD